MRLLFVVPISSLGGTTTSLTSLLNSKLADCYDIDVFVICQGDNIPELSSFDIGLNGLTTAFYGNYSTLNTIDKLKYLPIKILKQFSFFVNYLERWVVKKTVNKIEKRKQYDYVVAFQEKLATVFCQHFTINNKIAWIHCDFAKAYSRNDDDFTLYQQYIRIVCVSCSTRASFLEYFPSLENRTLAIYNLFDAENIIKKSQEEIEDDRFENDNFFSIISVGRINSVKRFDTIPGIAKQLQEKGIEFKWYIIGQPYSIAELNKLNRAIAESGIGNRVIYLGGKYNPYPYFLASDLLVCVSSTEACPMIFNEAKLLGLQIVSTDFPSAFEFIDDNRDGRITKIETMADTINEIISRQLTRSPSPAFNANELNEKILLQLTELFS